MKTNLSVLFWTLLVVSSPAASAQNNEALDEVTGASLFELGRGRNDPSDGSGATPGSVIPEMEMEEQLHLCEVNEPGSIKALVSISGIHSDEGNIRVQVYGDNPDDFLVAGRKVARVDVPSRVGEMLVCMTFPGAGLYAIAVLHDKNANGRVDILSEGFGFSNNPTLMFAPPDHDEVSFEVGVDPVSMVISLTYLFENETLERRRRSRR